MEPVRVFAESLFEFEAKSVKSNGPALSGLKCRSRIDAFIVATSLSKEKRQRLRGHSGNLQQVILITHPGQFRFFLFQTQACHIVGVLSIQADQILTRPGRQRGFGEKLRPRQSAIAAHKAVFSKMFFVEEHAVAQTVFLFDLLVEKLGVPRNIDSEFSNQGLRAVAVWKGSGDAHRAPIANECLSLVLKLVAPGMAAKVVMVVENENFVTGP